MNLDPDKRPLAEGRGGEMAHLKCLFDVQNRRDLRRMVDSPEIDGKVNYLRGFLRFVLRMGILRNKKWLQLKEYPPFGFTSDEWDSTWAFPHYWSVNNCWSFEGLLKRAGDVMALPKDSPPTPEQASKMATTPKRGRVDWEDEEEHEDEVERKRRRLSGKIASAPLEVLERMEQAHSPQPH